jgi:glycosyltransferase involved in cell wall biosynthesis
MEQPKDIPMISVVTPSFNQGRFLRQCIESVLLQTHRRFEFLIIDGGSTDETLSIIREYESSINYWISESDGGQSDAINKGFLRSSGEIVAWLNTDDYYLPGAFDSVVDAYRADPSAPFYFGDGLRVDETGSVIANFFPAGTLAFDRQALVMGLNYILQPSTFINRRALEQVGYLDTGLHYGLDSDFWMRLSGLGAPRVVPSVLAATREYATTKTASGSFERIEELRTISMKYSGLPITPGVLCYFLDTLHRFVQKQKDSFPAGYLSDIELFWQKTAALLERYNARSDGFPLTSKKPPRAWRLPWVAFRPWR